FLCMCLFFFYFFFFFFSSRRRHTRCLSDWSSDVCSSDLIRTPARCVARHKVAFDALVVIRARAASAQHVLDDRIDVRDTRAEARSEERRVGKEWRSGGSATEKKKNKK